MVQCHVSLGVLNTPSEVLLGGLGGVTTAAQTDTSAVKPWIILQKIIVSK